MVVVLAPAAPVLVPAAAVPARVTHATGRAVRPGRVSTMARRASHRWETGPPTVARRVRGGHSSRDTLARAVARIAVVRLDPSVRHHRAGRHGPTLRRGRPTGRPGTPTARPAMEAGPAMRARPARAVHPGTSVHHGRRAHPARPAREVRRDTAALSGAHTPYASRGVARRQGAVRTGRPGDRPIRSVPRMRRLCHRRTSSPTMKNSSPAGDPSKRRSSPVARRIACSSCRSAGRPSRSWCCMRQACVSRSSRSKAARSRRSPGSMVTRASRSSSRRAGSRRSRTSSPAPPSEARRPSSWPSIRSRTHRTSAPSCAAPKRRACMACSSRHTGRRRSPRRRSRHRPARSSTSCSAPWTISPAPSPTCTPAACGSPVPRRMRR